jgi:hypothetical protein
MASAVSGRKGLITLSAYASLAQLAEQLTLNQWVPGSSPGRCTKYLRVLAVRQGFHVRRKVCREIASHG